MMNNALTTKAKVRAGFAALRKAGYAARMNFSCCNTCGSYDLSETVRNRKLKGYVFWHRQSDTAWRGDELREGLWLGWNGDAADIVRILRESGLVVEHDSTDGRKIEVVKTL